MRACCNKTNPQTTAFQRLVYAALLEIPRGRVTTYKILADHLSAAGTGKSVCGGKHRLCRAVGQALRRNPFAPKVPCHRVIASDLTPGGFSAGGETSSKGGRSTPIRRKLMLLAKEGVKFKKGRLADPAMIYFFNLKKTSD